MGSDWNISRSRGIGIEGPVAVVAGAIAGSISLVGFGIDSFIEVTSGAVLLWRMSVDAHEQARERNKRLSLKIVGICFLGLAVYVAYEGVSDRKEGSRGPRSHRYRPWTLALWIFSCTIT